MPDRPVFIIGPPRSGTTLLYRRVSLHPEVGCFNRANKKLPGHPRLAGLLNRLGLYRGPARESRAIWRRFLPERSDDACGAEHATDVQRAWYQRVIGGLLEVRGASRFVAKMPSHSVQIPWLRALFDSAIFVVAMRDWRGVVGSTVVQGGGRWFGVRVPGFRDLLDEPPEVAAAWQFLEVHSVIDRELSRAPQRFTRVWYEDLCREPRKALAEVCGFAGLPWSDGIADRVATDVGPVSEKWRGVLTPDTVEALRERFPELGRYEVIQ